MQPLLNLDGSPQRWIDGIPEDELAIVADELGVTIEAILANEQLQIQADARHFDWLLRNGRLTGSSEFADYCTNQAGGR